LKSAAADPLLGFNDNSVRAGQVDAPTAARLAEGVGAGLDRVTFDWRYAEPTVDHYVLGDYDAIYRAMLARGVRPVWVLMFAPRWARDKGTLCFGDCRRPPAREAIGQWRQIAALLARRYPRSGGIEIWNEPNESLFWQPRPDPARYTQLLREAYLAIKRANPSMRVISGGVTDRSRPTAGGLSLREFLGAVLQGGGRRHLDAIGIHTYPRTVDVTGAEHAVDTAVSVRDATGAGGVPVWVTETGLSTTGDGLLPGFSEGQQADGVASLYRALRGRKDVGGVLFHTLVSPRGDVSSSAPGYGLLRGDLSPKPAYCSLVHLVVGGSTCPWQPVRAHRGLRPIRLH
jgi:hypothetical protein